jgi:isopentenyl diphosphate isomerase/L-lactate dehydrogenase-like FMN-dependent dehydrogenase
VIRRDALRRVDNVADLRRAARRALPRSVFEFVDGGAEDETTLRRNRGDFGDLALVPRVLRDVSVVDTATTVLGQRVAVPVLAAPTGLSTLVHPRGEVGIASGVHAAGSLYLLSGAAACTPEAVAAAATGTRPWFQLYLWRDRGRARELISRAHAAGFAALAISVDVPVAGRRERDHRNGFTIPPRIGPRTIAQGLARPRWSAGFVRGGGLSLGAMRGPRGPVAFAARVNAQMDPSLTWADLEWLREEWDRPLLVKGILHPDDAVRAVAAGVDGVVVSNHGGRQLDGAVSSIAALPAVVAAVGNGAEVFLDGGVRRATEVAKALALGARACLVGRPVLFGLAAGGDDGARRAIELLREELRTTMALLGCAAVDELGRDHVRAAGAADLNLRRFLAPGA